MRKVVLADNDVIHKFACCNLLEELLEWLGVPPAEVWVLPTMRFMLRKKLKANTQALSALEEFLKKVTDLPAAHPQTIDMLPGTMDVGEKQMLAVLVETPEVQHMVTGDKRALSLIGSLCVKDQALSQRLAQARVDCLESILLCLIDMFGFQSINAKIIQGMHSDSVLQMSFGKQRTEPHARQALDSYLRAVQAEASFVARDPAN